MHHNSFVSFLLLSLTANAAFAEHIIRFNAGLDSENEVPPVESSAKGFANLRVDLEKGRISYRLKAKKGQDLLGASGCHLHCGAEDENGPVIAFLAGVLQGGVKKLEIRSILTEINIINKETGCGSNLEELAQSMIDGNVYVNLHSDMYPSGEIRGQLELV